MLQQVDDIKQQAHPTRLINSNGSTANHSKVSECKVAEISIISAARRRVKNLFMTLTKLNRKEKEICRRLAKISKDDTLERIFLSI